MREQPPYQLGSKLAGVAFDHMRGKPHRTVDEIEGLPILELCPHVVQLQVVQPDASVVRIALRQRETDELLRGRERLAVAEIPQGPLDVWRGGHVLQQNRERQVAAAGGGFERIHTHLDGAQKVSVRIIRELRSDLRQVRAPDQPQHVAPVSRWFVPHHGAEHGKRQWQSAALLDQPGSLGPQVFRHAPGPACQQSPGLLGSEQTGDGVPPRRWPRRRSCRAW
ncbi:MAG TPA: hypothetical protein VIY49_13005 [Bryobacteraceae bacterium]